MNLDFMMNVVLKVLSMLSSVAIVALVRLAYRQLPFVFRTSSSKPRVSPAPTCLNPPRGAEFVMYFLPRCVRDPLLGDLEQVFREIVAKFGERPARVWYCAQVAIAVVGSIRDAVKRRFGLDILTSVLDRARRKVQ